MSAESECCGPVRVVKIGGSILTDAAAYERVATALCQRFRKHGERIVAVASAAFGVTDQLAAEARSVSATPDAATLDLLWSAGETRSVALLTLWAQRCGVDARALGVHECGLTASPIVGGSRYPTLSPLRLRARLAQHPLVFVPGFFARTPGDGLTTLGRGGSDLSAVLIAAGLGVQTCELIKDVPGYFTSDPRTNTDAQPISRLSYDEAIALAIDGCELVQDVAIRAAEEFGTVLLIRSLAADATQTLVDRGGAGCQPASDRQDACPTRSGGSRAQDACPTLECCTDTKH